MDPVPEENSVTDVDLAASGPGGSSRRRFLAGVAAGSAALAVGSQLPLGGMLPAAGQDEFEPTADEALASFLAGLALAANQAYGIAAATPGLTESTLNVVRSFGTHYTSHAATLNALLSDVVSPVNDPNQTLLAEVTGALTGQTDVATVLGSLADLEDRMSATYFEAMGGFEEITDAGRMATLAGVPGRHATVLRHLIAPDGPRADLVPETQDGEGAFTVADYPPGPAEVADTADTAEADTESAGTETEG